MKIRDFHKRGFWVSASNGMTSAGPGFLGFGLGLRSSWLFLLKVGGER